MSVPRSGRIGHDWTTPWDVSLDADAPDTGGAIDSGATVSVVAAIHRQDVPEIVTLADSFVLPLDGRRDFSDPTVSTAAEVGAPFRPLPDAANGSYHWDDGFRRAGDFDLGSILGYWRFVDSFDAVWSPNNFGSSDDWGMFGFF